MSEHADKPTPHRYTLGEEIANTVTHGLGVALSSAGLGTMLVFAGLYGNAWHVVSAAIYGASLVMLYTASTLYHGLQSPRAKHVFKVLDHSGVYVLIAGTYTPFTLVTMRGPWGWSLFGTVWGLAIVGVAVEAFWVHRPKWLSALVYIGMGWIVVAVAKPLLAALAPAGLWLLLAGGLCYTGGTAFYVNKRIRYMHTIWHVWVLGGSICHYLAIILYVLPDAG